MAYGACEWWMHLRGRLAHQAILRDTHVSALAVKVCECVADRMFKMRMRKNLRTISKMTRERY
jgi:hypothetical protein